MTPYVIRIILKDEEKKLTFSHLIYEDGLMLSTDHEPLSLLIKQAVKEFSGQPENIRVQISFDV